MMLACSSRAIASAIDDSSTDATAALRGVGIASSVGGARPETAGYSHGSTQPSSREKTTMPLAGMTMAAEQGNPCIGGPLASTLPPLPATMGFTQLS